MSEVDEIEVITNGGVPFYYHSNTGREQDNTYILQASFITALTQFADELNNGQVKLISMEKKHYLLTRSQEFTLIFTSYDETGPETLMSLSPKITEVKDYLNDKILQLNLDMSNPTNKKMDQPLQDFDDYLKHEELVVGEHKFTTQKIRDEFNRLIFRSVGYEPGKCNIGRAERMKRLTFGLTGFVVSFLLYSLIFLLNLPTWTVFFLAIPNFFGFLGSLQYFYRFCTTNALNQEYDMN